MDFSKETKNRVDVTIKLLCALLVSVLVFLAGQITCFASTVVLQWDPNTDTDLSGYKVYYQADSSTQPFQGAAPVNVNNQTTATISGLDPSHAYYFAVTAYNSSGIESAYSNIVSVPELVSPAVAISNPAGSTSVSGTVSVTASASDNVGVSKVEFYVNGILQTTDTSTPYLYSWNTASFAAGSNTLMAKAYDAAGNVGQSANVTVTVVNDTAAPTVSVTAPSNNTTVSGTISITSSASDNVGLSRVEFYANGVLLSATNVSPYSYPWNTTSVANGSYILTAKAYDSAGNVGQSGNLTVTVSNTVPDSTAPTVNTFTLPVTATTLTAPVSSLTATDNVAVTGYMITESTTAPTANATGWNASAPTSFTFSSAGNKTAYAWAKDAAGNVSASRSASVNITLPDTTAPTMSAFTLPSTATALTVSVSSLTATDNVAVTGYMITESATAPAASTAGWSASAPATFVFSAAGSKTAYAWAKDAAGNVSASRSASVTITLPDTTSPTVSAFTLPTSATTLTVSVSSLTATDNVGVTGYMITESSTAPAASAAGWSASAPSTFIFSAAGPKTAYAWAKDAAGNVSNNRSATVTITLPDTTKPTVSAFTMPTTATALTVSVSSLTATDNVAVTGYMITESATAPAASAAGWSASAPATFVFSAAGSKTAYAWAKDAAGNVSASRSASVTITLPDTTAPTLSIFSPFANATVLGTAYVSADASDNIGVSKVEFYVKGNLSATVSTPPYTFNWNTTVIANGSYALTAKAYDAAGNVGQSATVTVTVNNPVPDTTAPSVSTYSMPATATSLTVPITTFTASDNVAVTGYLVTESSETPSTSASWSATAPTTFTFSAAGARTAYAWAKDAAGNISASRSANLTITLPDTVAPIVSITSPDNGATVSGTVIVTATATDNVAVAKVELYIKDVLTKTDTASPFSFTWDTTSIANGSYSLSFKAYDVSGNSKTSTVTVTVSNKRSVIKKRGDLNGDGKVNLADALLALKSSVGLTPQTVNSMETGATDDGLDGDVAPLDSSGTPLGDGMVNISDALVLLKYSVGLASW